MSLFFITQQNCYKNKILNIIFRYVMKIIWSIVFMQRQFNLIIMFIETFRLSQKQTN